MNTNSGSGANYNSRYVSFRDEMEEDGSSTPYPSEPTTTMISDMELLANGGASSKTPGTSSGEMSAQRPTQPKRIRLRAVESERDFFLKLINVDLFTKLVMLQVSMSLVIVLAQIIMYAINSWERYRTLDSSGIGIWGPIIFFVPTCFLTFVSIKSPSGCILGTAMASHIVSIVVGLLLILLSTVALAQQGKSNWRLSSEEEYDHEIPARICSSFMVLAAICQVVASMIASIQYCRITCCGRSDANELILFDVESVAA